MAKDEVQAWFDGEVSFSELAPSAQWLVLALQERGTRKMHDTASVIDERSKDEIGPWFRIAYLIEGLSGDASRWIGVDEIAELVAAEVHIAQWVNNIAEAASVTQREVIESVIDTWCMFELEGWFESQFIIETTYSVDGPLWRAKRPATDAPVGTVAELVEQLVSRYGGIARSETQGRYQVSLPDLEVFIGHDTDPELTSKTLSETPTTISALCGVEMAAHIEVDEVVRWFSADPAKPKDMKVVLTAGVGHQVWLDRTLSPQLLTRMNSATALDELITHARRLNEALRPWDANPPSL